MRLYVATSVAFSASWQTKNRSVSGPAAMTSRYVNGTHVHESRLDSSLGMQTVSDLSSRCDMCPRPIRAFCATVPFSNNQVCFAFGAKKGKEKRKQIPELFCLRPSGRQVFVVWIGRLFDSHLARYLGRGISSGSCRPFGCVGAIRTQRRSGGNDTLHQRFGVDRRLWWEIARLAPRLWWSRLP